MYSERENKIVLVSLSEGTMGKGKKISEWKILKKTHLCKNTI
jgi:hypothetical protein